MRQEPARAGWVASMTTGHLRSTSGMRCKTSTHNQSINNDVRLNVGYIVVDTALQSLYTALLLRTFAGAGRRLHARHGRG